LIARVLPFASYMFVLGVGNGFAWFCKVVPALSAWQTPVDLWLYPVKTAVALAPLVYFWPEYGELAPRNARGAKDLLLAGAAGLLVYLAWVRMDWSWASRGNASGYDPFVTGALSGGILAAVRVMGAASVVPIIEELFWRSFLLRYVISPRFESVPLGTFTTTSFVVTTVLFGLEHRLVVAGMMAGAVYSLLLYRSRQLWTSIFAHAVTNLALATHVLVTREWFWW
jgi:CAAX prenyl protease-like protein